jgi:hypothetical protein
MKIIKQMSSYGKHNKKDFDRVCNMDQDAAYALKYILIQDKLSHSGSDTVWNIVGLPNAQDSGSNSFQVGSI